MDMEQLCGRVNVSLDRKRAHFVLEIHFFSNSSNEIIRLQKDTVCTRVFIRHTIFTTALLRRHINVHHRDWIR